MYPFYPGTSPERIVLDGTVYVRPVEVHERDNPFVVGDYDYDRGFYRGTFEYLNPVTGRPTIGTPEEYGRARIVVALLKLGADTADIIDLGAGNLNIARELLEAGGKIAGTFANVDISGPWSHSRPSALEVGARRLTREFGRIPGLICVQYDLNQGCWPFAADSADVVVSCMACHHVRTLLKNQFMADLFATVRPGGTVLVMDFFKASAATARCLTTHGGGGPRECAGYGEAATDFLARAQRFGFVLDAVSAAICAAGDAPVTADFAESFVEPLLGLAVSPMTWYATMIKP